MRTSVLFLGSMLLVLSACGQAEPDQSSGKDATISDHVSGPTLSVQEFDQARGQGNAVLVDVRTPQEFASGHIPGSVNIDWTAPDYETSFATLDAKRPVLLYCAVGGRSDQAREYLHDKGFVVQDLQDGIAAWKEAGLPIER